MANTSNDGQVPATILWRDLTHDPDQTGYHRWCAGQATAHADRLATLHPATTGHRYLAVRDETWHENAVQYYAMLTEAPEPATALTQVCVVADRDAIAAWLDQPAPPPYAGSMDEFLGLQYLSDEWPGALPALVEYAQHAALFGIPEHTIRLHNVNDPTADWSSHLLTVHTPTGMIIATSDITTTDLVGDPTGPPPQIAVAALRCCTDAVNSAFTRHGPAATTTSTRARPFLTLGVIEPATEPSPSPDPTDPATPQRPAVR